MLQYVAQRMMDMDVESLCAAAYAKRSVLVSEARRRSRIDFLSPEQRASRWPDWVLRLTRPDRRTHIRCRASQVSASRHPRKTLFAA